VLEHDATGADADGGGGGRDAGDEDLGGGAGEAGGIVVLGEPVAGVAETLGELGEFDGFLERVAGGAAGADRGLIEDAKKQWPRPLTPSLTQGPALGASHPHTR
jgi:hypothetical protein